MTLTLRRTDLATVPAYAHLADWAVLEDGRPISNAYTRSTRRQAGELACRCRM
jgi:hypothetical protein